MIHEVKTWKEYFQPQREGKKLFELRKDDRNYQVGDEFKSKEWDNETNSYTGRSNSYQITYVLRDAEHFGLMEGYCIIQLREWPLGF